MTVGVRFWVSILIVSTVVSGHGPVASNTDAAGRAKNRRVELVAR